jgi:hypothetical protein
LPDVLPAQAQKHVIHNAALERLDALVQMSVETAAGQTPPETVTPGQVGPNPTGVWTGWPLHLAQATETGWPFEMPGEGWLAYDKGSAQIRYWDGSDWAEYGARPLDQLD